jgi:hypothetical protein
MDGPVVVTEEKLKRVVQNYNAHLAKARNSSQDGSVPDKYASPLQLDHSESAKETVGRVYDDLEMGIYKLLDGREVAAIYGHATFIGADNCKKGGDGTWAHVSIGADFESGELYELTITPFPAAPEASLLSKGSSNKLLNSKNGDKLMGDKAKCLKYMMEKKEMSKEVAEQKYEKMSDEDIKKMCGDYDKMSEGDKDDKDKKDLAAGDVSKMSDDKDKEDKDNLAAGDVSKMSDGDKDDDKKDEAKMAAGDITKMSEEDKGMMKKLMSFLSKLMGDDKEDKKDEAKMSEGDDDKKDKTDMSADKDKDKDEMAAGDVKKMKDRYMKKLMDDGMEKDKAEEKMGKMSDQDIAKAIEKHEAELHPKDGKTSAKDDDKKDDKTKMSSAGKDGVRLSKESSDKFTKLATGFKKDREEARLAVKKAKIGHRLGALRSEAKITPAEIKKINVDELASKSTETIDEVFKAYEQRQPVINAGIIGTQKAMDVGQLGAEMNRLKASESTVEHLSNMPFLKQAMASKLKKHGEEQGISENNTSLKRLSAVAHMDKMSQNEAEGIPVNALKDEEIDKLVENFETFIRDGKTDDAVRLMKATLGDVKKLRASTGATVLNQEDRIKNIEESFDKLSEAFDGVLEIVNPLISK